MAIKIPLEMIEVASPCTASWDAMCGDDKARLCGQCDQHVYNLSDMTRAEAEALVEEREGKLCVRFFQRADGTMLTADCPVGLRAILRRETGRLPWLVAGSICALWGFITLGVLSTGSDNGEFRAHLPAPVARMLDWIFPEPQCVMGIPAPLGIPAPPPGGAQAPGVAAPGPEEPAAP